MSIYSPDSEEFLYFRGQIKKWFRSHLITEKQRGSLLYYFPDPFRSTNMFFRFLLFGFTLLCLASTTLFFIWIFEIRKNLPTGFFLILTGIPVYYLAERIIGRFQLYRHGIEEALALGGAGMVVIGLSQFIDHFVSGYPKEIFWSGLITFVCFQVVYRRLGYMIALVISFWGLCLTPFPFSLSQTTERIILIAVVAGLFLWTKQTEQDHEYEFQKSRANLIQALLFLVLYVSINLQLDRTLLGVIGVGGNRTLGYSKIFFWVSYVATFVLPIISLVTGFKKRKRWMIDVGLVTAILSLMTNKSYLGLTRYAWDPIILGVFMMGVAVVAIRWFEKDKDRTRKGYTSKNLLKPETYGFDPAALAATMAPAPGAPESASSDQGENFGGGQSGGGGASSAF